MFLYTFAAAFLFFLVSCLEGRNDKNKDVAKIYTKILVTKQHKKKNQASAGRKIKKKNFVFAIVPLIS